MVFLFCSLSVNYRIKDDASCCTVSGCVSSCNLSDCCVSSCSCSGSTGVQFERYLLEAIISIVCAIEEIPAGTLLELSVHKTVCVLPSTEKAKTCKI
jgi:hypothetical protein